MGFTHICGKTRKGQFTVKLQTQCKRMRAKLKAIQLELKRRLHTPLPAQGQWLRAVVTGHYRYYGVPRNGPALCEFRHQVIYLWKRALERRSQVASITRERMSRIAERGLPKAKICHPYPSQRLRVTT